MPEAHLDRSGRPARRRLAPGLLGFVAVCAAAAALLFVGPTTPLGHAEPGSLVSKTISVGGSPRTYLVYVPAGHDPGVPTPVVFALHGLGMTAQQMVALTGFNLEADAGRFLTVYPQGRQARQHGRNKRVWYDTDVAFISQVIDALAAEYAVDRHRVYASGLSDGGVLAYSLACRLADRVAAVAAVAATQNTAACAPSRPISVVHLHGTLDPAFPVEGLTRRGREISRPIPDVVESWRRTDGCPGAPEVTLTYPNGTQVTTESSTGCAEDTEVTFHLIRGGGHIWFGVPVSGPNAALDASAVIWQFFRANPMPGAAPEPTPIPTSTPTLTPTPESTPTSTPEPTPTSTPEPTLIPTPTSTPDPTSEPTVGPDLRRRAADGPDGRRRAGRP